VFTAIFKTTPVYIDNGPKEAFQLKVACEKAKICFYFLLLIKEINFII